MEAAALSLLIYLSGGGAAVIFSVARVRSMMQRRADKMRRTFEVIFPSDMKHDQVLAFIHSLSGLPGPKFLQPVHAIVFETYADEMGVKNFIHIPGHVNSRVDNLMEEHIEGIVITPVEDDLIAKTEWYATELGMKGFNEQLRVERAPDIARSVRAGFKTLTKGEAIVLQWVIFRGNPRPVTPETKTKLSDNTFYCAARIGAVGEQPDRLIRDVYAGLSTTHVYGARFTKRTSFKVADKLRRRAGALTYPIFLNALELSAVMGWPLDGGSRHVARSLAPDATA
jgi:hypothetical protein